MEPVKYAYYITYQLAGHLRSEDFLLESPIRGAKDLGAIYRHIANVIFSGRVDHTGIAILNVLRLPGDDVYPEQTEVAEPIENLAQVAQSAYLGVACDQNPEIVRGDCTWDKIEPWSRKAWTAAAEAVAEAVAAPLLGRIADLEQEIENLRGQLDDPDRFGGDHES